MNSSTTLSPTTTTVSPNTTGDTDDYSLFTVLFVLFFAVVVVLVLVLVWIFCRLGRELGEPESERHQHPGMVESNPFITGRPKCPTSSSNTSDCTDRDNITGHIFPPSQPSVSYEAVALDENVQTDDELFPQRLRSPGESTSTTEWTTDRDIITGHIFPASQSSTSYQAVAGENSNLQADDESFLQDTHIDVLSKILDSTSDVSTSVTANVKPNLQTGDRSSSQDTYSEVLSKILDSNGPGAPTSAVADIQDDNQSSSQDIYGNIQSKIYDSRSALSVLSSTTSGDELPVPWRSILQLTTGRYLTMDKPLIGKQRSEGSDRARQDIAGGRGVPLKTTSTPSYGHSLRSIDESTSCRNTCGDVDTTKVFKSGFTLSSVEEFPFKKPISSATSSSRSKEDADNEATTSSDEQPVPWRNILQLTTGRYLAMERPPLRKQKAKDSDSTQDISGSCRVPLKKIYEPLYSHSSQSIDQCASYQNTGSDVDTTKVFESRSSRSARPLSTGAELSMWRQTSQSSNDYTCSEDTDADYIGSKVFGSQSSAGRISTNEPSEHSSQDADVSDVAAKVIKSSSAESCMMKPQVVTESSSQTNYEIAELPPKIGLFETNFPYLSTDSSKTTKTSISSEQSANEFESHSAFLPLNDPSLEMNVAAIPSSRDSSPSPAEDM